jgi:hypothetical protein
MMTISFNSIILKGPNLVKRVNEFGVESLNALEKKIFAKYESFFKTK